jgi:hypothetical protein
MRPQRLIAAGAIVALLALGACKGGEEAANVEEEAGEGVAMAADVQAKMGVKTAPLAAAKSRAVAQVFARVIDAGPLAQLAAEIAAARAAADASAAEAKRLEALAAADQSASPKAVETARAQAGADEARARLSEQRVGLEWGPGLAALGEGGRAQVLNDIAAGRASLVRIDAPNVAVRDIRAIRLRLARDGAPITASSLGPAVAADPRLLAAASFALVRGAAAQTLPAGRVLFGEVETGAPRDGALIPREAIVRMDGKTWVYVPAADDTFERKEVSEALPLDAGWFVQGAFRPGEIVVTEGAGSLLAVERGPDEGE